MDHLTTNEIIEFVSIRTPDAASLRLASRVNGHILQCRECLRLVEAFQNVSDELQMMERTAEYENIMSGDTPSLASEAEAGK